MADLIRCPVCGEMNPPDTEFCQNCQSRLHPLTGPLKGEDAPLMPGQIPTKKVTSELEPILPQWLRDARSQARKSAEEEAVKQAEEKQQTTPVPPPPDLLAGLASQKETEDDDTPDWLTTITGVPARKKKQEPDEPSVKFVELGHEEPDKPASSKAATSANAGDHSGLTAWMAGGEGTSEKDDLADWFAQATTSEVKESPAYVPPTPPTPPTPPAPAPEAAPSFDPSVLDPTVPDWLKDLESSQGEPAQTKPLPEIRPAASVEVPEWLTDLESSPTAIEEHPTPPSAFSNAEVPAQFSDFGANAPVSQPAAPANIPPEEIFPPTASPQPAGAGSKPDVPDWLRAAAPTSQMRPPAQTEAAAAEESALPPAVLPDWLSALKPTPATPPETPAQTPPPAEETPDWLAALKATQPTAPESNQAESVFANAEQPMQAALTPGDASAFTADSLSKNDTDEVFGSLQLPDWLTKATAASRSGAEATPLPAANKEEAISPAELPSWVQAMRPVQSVLPDAGAASDEAVVETMGPLAGLQGVLPGAPDAAVPTAKPKSHSIKISASNEQQTQAALLEQILAAETAPIPMKAGSVLASQRVLRWALSVVLILVLSGVFFSGTQIFPLPDMVPTETNSAIQAVNAVPAGAAVLAVFDYQPSTVGEMEATGSSVMDHLLLLKHPRLTLVSTSPTGAALAERFITTTLAKRNYSSGSQYVDLGFLAGGLTGVYDFALDPSAAMPLGVNGSAVWQSPPLQGVVHLSDFAAVVVLTDSADSGRVWIEQTAASRGKVPMIVISSAQAGPILMPYFDSGQIAGLVAGLNGAAGAEQSNGGLPGFVRAYWDAYSVGLLVAVLLIVVGGLWNLVLGIQARRAQESE